MSSPAPLSPAAASCDADEIVRLLGLVPHPEGGHFRETYRDTATVAGGRSASTAIYYLLRAGETSQWHRVDATEIWHWYAGAPLALARADDGGLIDTPVLGPDLAAGHRPQAIVPPGVWQSATSLGAFTLVGCTVAPAFEFAGFEMAAPGWSPRSRD